MERQRKIDKKSLSWAMYDWANSVYSLAISTVLLPIYYEEVTTLARPKAPL